MVAIKLVVFDIRKDASRIFSNFNIYSSQFFKHSYKIAYLLLLCHGHIHIGGGRAKNPNPKYPKS